MSRVSMHESDHLANSDCTETFLITDMLNYISFFSLDHRISCAPKLEHCEISNETNTSTGVSAFLQEREVSFTFHMV